MFTNSSRRLNNLFWKYVPTGAAIAVVAFIAGSQLVSPHRRMVKASLFLIVVAIIMRFDMVYSLYFFVLMFPFPSGIAITSTNIALMTVLTMLWIVRANQTGQQIFYRTEIDKFVLLFLLAFVLSFFNETDFSRILQGVKIVWKQLTAIALFYLIVRFVDDEVKLERITKVMCLSMGLVALTGLLELLAPGTTIIPGWLVTKQQFGQGAIGYRLEGIRVGGVLQSQALMADYCALTLPFIILHMIRSINPIQRLLWLVVFGIVFTTLSATANRGAFLALAVAGVYSFWVLRHHVSVFRLVGGFGVVVALFIGAQLVLTEYTLAGSILDRVMGTKFEEAVPESRQGAWGPVFERAMEHIFIGHGPYYGVTRGLNALLWPHNALLYWLYTIGLFGMFAFIGIVVQLGRTSLKHARPAFRGQYLGVVMAVLHLDLVILVIVQMRTDHQRDFEYIYIYVVWMLFAFISTTGRLIDRREAALAQAAVAPGDALAVDTRSEGGPSASGVV